MSKDEEIAQLKESLAAERDKVKDLEQVWNALDENQQLKQQLAAEREQGLTKWRQATLDCATLVDALKDAREFLVSFKGIDTDRHARMIDAALAKVKEAK